MSIMSVSAVGTSHPAHTKRCHYHRAVVGASSDVSLNGPDLARAAPPSRFFSEKEWLFARKMRKNEDGGAVPCDRKDRVVILGITQEVHSYCFGSMKTCVVMACGRYCIEDSGMFVYIEPFDLRI